MFVLADADLLGGKGLCSKIANDVSNRLAEVQNQIGAIRDCLQIAEANLLDFADYYYDVDTKTCLK